MTKKKKKNEKKNESDPIKKKGATTAEGWQMKGGWNCPMQYPHTTLDSLISPHILISPVHPVCLRYSLSQLKECFHKYFSLFIKHCYGIDTQEVLMIMLWHIRMEK